MAWKKAMPAAWAVIGEKWLSPPRWRREARHLYRIAMAVACWCFGAVVVLRYGFVGSRTRAYAQRLAAFLPTTRCRDCRFARFCWIHLGLRQLDASAGSA